MDQEICMIRGQFSPSLLDKVRNLQKDTCGPGRDCQNGKRHPGQIIYGQNFGKECQRTLSWGRSIIGQLKNQSLTMQEDYEDSISLTLMTEFKEIWFPLCFARLARKTSMVKPVARLMVSSLSLHVYWKPVNPQDCVWKNLYRNMTRTISQEKETIHQNIIILFTNLFLCLKSWRYPQQKQQWIKNGRNLKNILAWDKSQKQIRGDRWSKDEGRKSSFCLTDGHLSFAECRIGESTKKYKGRVVLRGDIVKDDSGSYAVFAEQGSSASQMTAAKVTMRLGESFLLGMPIRTPWKRIILICVCGWQKKLAGKKQNINPMWKVLNKEVDWENQHHSLIMYTWDALKDNVK